MKIKNKLIIGLTGPNAAGKGEVCKYLETKGFLVMSLSDILRKECLRRNLPVVRDNLIILGNTLRAKYGADILAKRLIKEIRKKSCNNNIVVDSIRTVGEVEQFRKVFKKNFVLINISSPQKIRFKFMLKRGRDGDPKNFAEFLKIEKKERSNSVVKQQIHKCRKLSDYFINNNSTLSKLYQKVEVILTKIFKKLKNERKNFEARLG